jgi:hypothetical protein
MFHVDPDAIGHQGNLDDQMEALELDARGRFFGLEIRTEVIPGQPGYYVYARVQCR